MDLLAQPQDNTPAFDPSKDYFTELVGENAKFKTPQDLAASKVRSDLYIKDVLRQKDELATQILEMQKQLDAQASMEDLIDKMESRYSSREQPEKTSIQPNLQSIKTEDIDSLIESRLTQREQKRIEDSNIAESKKMLKEHLGDNYLTVVRERIEGLELSESEINRMARTSPKTLARVLGLEKQQDNTLFQAPPTSQRRNETFKPSVQKRTWTYYQNLKKENPRLYLDPKIAVQMHNDHIAMGTAFEDGDFHQN